MVNSGDIKDFNHLTFLNCVKNVVGPCTVPEAQTGGQVLQHSEQEMLIHLQKQYTNLTLKAGNVASELLAIKLAQFKETPFTWAHHL